eukprot:sb/3477764/
MFFYATKIVSVFGPNIIGFFTREVTSSNPSSGKKKIFFRNYLKSHNNRKRPNRVFPTEPNRTEFEKRFYRTEPNRISVTEPNRTIPNFSCLNISRKSPREHRSRR